VTLGCAYQHQRGAFPPSCSHVQILSALHHFLIAHITIVSFRHVRGIHLVCGGAVRWRCKVGFHGLHGTSNTHRLDSNLYEYGRCTPSPPLFCIVVANMYRLPSGQPLSSSMRDVVTPPSPRGRVNRTSPCAHRPPQKSKPSSPRPQTTASLLSSPISPRPRHSSPSPCGMMRCRRARAHSRRARLQTSLAS
jgi:hypothetical protein